METVRVGGAFFVRDSKLREAEMSAEGLFSLVDFFRVDIRRQ